MTNTATDRQHAAADALITRVGEFGAVFRKDTDGTWRVIARAELAAPGAIVEVTKADGTTKRVRVTRTNRSGKRVGVAFKIVDFTDRIATHSHLADMDAADAAGRAVNGNGQIWD